MLFAGCFTHIPKLFCSCFVLPPVSVKGISAEGELLKKDLEKIRRNADALKITDASTALERQFLADIKVC